MTRCRAVNYPDPHGRTVILIVYEGAAHED